MMLIKESFLDSFCLIANYKLFKLINTCLGIKFCNLIISICQLCNKLFNSTIEKTSSSSISFHLSCLLMFIRSIISARHWYKAVIMVILVTSKHNWQWLNKISSRLNHCKWGVKVLSLSLILVKYLVVSTGVGQLKLRWTSWTDLRVILQRRGGS